MMRLLTIPLTAVCVVATEVVEVSASAPLLLDDSLCLAQLRAYLEPEQGRQISTGRDISNVTSFVGWTHLVSRARGPFKGSVLGRGNALVPKEPPDAESLVVALPGSETPVSSHGPQGSSSATFKRRARLESVKQAFPFSMSFRDPNDAWTGGQQGFFLLLYVSSMVMGCLVVHYWERIVALLARGAGKTRFLEFASCGSKESTRSAQPDPTEEKAAASTRLEAGILVAQTDVAEASAGPLPPYDAEGRVVDWFFAQAKERRLATAVVVPGGGTEEPVELTYEVLAAAVSEMATALVDNGVVCGSVVALVLDRSVGQLVAVYGALKSGAAFLPIAHDSPLERKRFMLKESDTVALVGTANDALSPGLAEEISATFIAVPTDGSLGKLQISPPRSRASPVTAQLPAKCPADDMALLIYTSGTTGTPKGIVYDHRHLTHGVHFFGEQCEMDATTVGLLKSPYFWAIIEYELFPALVRGGKLVIASAEGHKSPAYLANSIRSQEVSVLMLTPQVLDLVLDMHEADHSGHAPLSSLKHIVTVGEPLGCSLANRVVQTSNVQAQLHNFYGASESSCTIYTIPPEGVNLDIFPNKVPAGRPQPHASVYIMIAQTAEEASAKTCRRLAPSGEAGEICFGGVLAARYWKQAKLTSEKWVDTEYGRLYATGDLGRWRAGVLEVIGRTDRQVKIKGVRIEPEEVEAVLRKFCGQWTGPALKEAAVVATKDPGAELVAYVSTREGAPDVTVDALRVHCKASLTPAYVPKHFIVLPSLPLLPNGKTNLVQLREMATKHIEEEGEVVMDSLGLMKKMSKSAVMETAVIHRCYAFWMIGVLSDHVCRCAMDIDKHMRIYPYCSVLASTKVPPWIEILVRSMGNDQDMFGFIMLGAYQDSRSSGPDGQKRVGFGSKDLYMFAIYMAAAMPIPQILRLILRSETWPIYWMGDPEPTNIWNLSYMQVTSHVAGHRWYLWMCIYSRAYMAICEKCRIPGWLQSVIALVPCLLPFEYAFDICKYKPAPNSVKFIASWLFDASGGSCGLYFRWVQWYAFFYVICFHFIRPVVNRAQAVLPKGRMWGAAAIAVSATMGTVMAMYHYPNYALEGEKASLWWAALELATAMAQPALFAWGMAYVPLDLAWWGNTTLGCYIFHFYFRDQFSVLILVLSNWLAFDKTGFLFLISLLIVLAFFTTVVGPASHFFLIGPSMMKQHMARAGSWTSAMINKARLAAELKGK